MFGTKNSNMKNFFVTQKKKVFFLGIFFVEVETWCAGANSVQRRGRAGRVSKGICFHLYTEEKFNSFPRNQLPEIHRSSLEHVCLQLQFIRETATSKRTKGKTYIKK